jgi:hypothetical protein
MEKQPQVFEGRTSDAEAPFVSAAFWTEGKQISGVVTKIFMSQASPDKQPDTCYVLTLDEPVELDGEEWDRVSVGNLAGFRMALQAMGLDRLKVKDALEMECTDIKAAKKEGYSPRPNFRLRISRP